MKKTSNSFDEIKGVLVDIAKDHPLSAAVGTGIALALAYAIPKLAPTFESIGKYAVDKFVERLPAATTQHTLNEKVVVEVSATELTDDSKAA